MNNLNKSIPCPNSGCKSEVIINVQELLAGIQYECQECKSTFGLSSNSMAVVEKAYSEFLKISK